MTFTFDDTDISTDLAKVRTIIGDIDANDPLLSDEQINFYLSENNNDIYAASRDASRAIQSKFARLADTTVETVSVKYSQKAAGYAALAEDLDKKVGESGTLVTPYVGGVSIDDMDSVEDNNDRVKPKFKIDQFSNPPSGVDDEIQDL